MPAIPEPTTMGADLELGGGKTLQLQDHQKLPPQENQLPTVPHLTLPMPTTKQAGKIPEKALKQPPTNDLKPYNGPPFPGTIGVPVAKLMAKSASRIKRNESCKKLLRYMLFLLVCMGIVGSYPVATMGEAESEMRQWVNDQKWGPQGDRKNVDVSNWSEFWIWFSESLIVPLTNDNDGGGTGVLLEYNSIIGGVVLWQRRVQVSEECTPAQQLYVSECRVIGKDEAKWNDTLVDPSISALLPKFTLFDEERRDMFAAKVFQIVDSPTPLTDSNLVNLTKVLEDVNELERDGWIGKGTQEVIAQLISYNPNTELFVSVEVRFVGRLTGGIDSFIHTWAGVDDSLGESISRANGAPWQVRMTLEIIFCVRILMFFVQEIAQLISWQHKSGMSGLKAYFGYFWNYVDWTVIALSVLLIYVQIIVYEQEQELRSLFISQNGKLDEQGIISLYATFTSLINYTDVRGLIIAIFALVSFFRLFKYFAFHPRLGVVSRTFDVASTHLGHFFIVLFVVSIGYAVAGWIIFAKTNPRFRTLWGCLATVAEMGTVGLGFDEVVGAGSATPFDQKLIAAVPIAMFYYGFTFVVFIVLAGILLSIIIASYLKVLTTFENEPDPDVTVWDDIRALGKMLHRNICGSGIPHNHAGNAKMSPDQLTKVDIPAPASWILFSQLKDFCKAMNNETLVATYIQAFGKPGDNDFTVEFDYNQLRDSFSDHVALYLWSNFRKFEKENEGQDSTRFPSPHVENKVEKFLDVAAGRIGTGPEGLDGFQTSHVDSPVRGTRRHSLHDAIEMLITQQQQQQQQHQQQQLGHHSTGVSSDDVAFRNQVLEHLDVLGQQVNQQSQQIHNILLFVSSQGNQTQRGDNGEMRNSNAVDPLVNETRNAIQGMMGGMSADEGNHPVSEVHYTHARQLPLLSLDLEGVAASNDMFAKGQHAVGEESNGYDQGSVDERQEQERGLKRHSKKGAHRHRVQHSSGSSSSSSDAGGETSDSSRSSHGHHHHRRQNNNKARARSANNKTTKKKKQKKKVGYKHSRSHIGHKNRLHRMGLGPFASNNVVEPETVSGDSRNHHAQILDSARTTASSSDGVAKLFLLRILQDGAVRVADVRSACQTHVPPVPWSTAKRVRRSLGIKQYRSTGEDDRTQYWGIAE